jgi:hypothetical protein
MSVIIDHIDPALSKGLDEDCCMNEISTLYTLEVGLCQIAREVKQREEIIHSKRRESGKPSSFWGFPPDQDERELQWVTCLFHWYGVSVCNYARLVGLLKNLSENTITRKTLEIREKKVCNGVKDSCDQYTKNIPELAEVLKWRHKVFAHFAITAPHMDDNIATLDVSVMSPVGYDKGRFNVGGFRVSKTSKTDPMGKSSISSLPQWSLTEVHERLAKRYWPDFQFQEVR